MNKRRGVRSAWLVVPMIVLLAPVVGATAKAEETFNVAVRNRQFYAQTDATGHPVTFESALIQELCTAMKVTCKLQYLTFADVLDAVADGRADIGLASVIKTQDRERQYLFTDPYLTMNFVFIAKVGKFSSIDDCMVPGRKIAVTKATSPYNFILTKPGLALTVVDDGADTIAAVNRDQVDCALTVTFRALSALLERGNKDAGLETVGNPFSPEGFSGGAGIIVPLHHEELRDRLNLALRAALADGRYDALTNKFLPFSFY